MKTMDNEKLCDVYPARAVVSLYYGFKDPEGEKISIEKRMSRELYAVRVCVVAGWILIGADSPDGPVLVFSQKISDQHKIRTGKDAESFVITENGRLVVFKKDDECGCGSKLRAWNPLKTVKTLISEASAQEEAVLAEIKSREESEEK